MQQTCLQCSAPYEVAAADLAFLERVSPVFGGKKFTVPPPQLCAMCRLRRRLAFRNERKLYNRKSDLSGKEIISIYSPDKPFTVYTLDEWWGDTWDGTDFGRPFDFARPFFEQFRELLSVVPRTPFFAKNNVNCDYTNGTTADKDCYLLFVSDHCEAAHYSYGLFECNQVLDCLDSVQCELCYECIGCSSCYNSLYLNDCSTTRDSAFLYDCKNCSNCFACVGLRNKEYCILNEQYTKEEYQEKMKAFRFDDRASVAKARALLQAKAYKHPRLFMHGLQNEHSTGDYANNCKNSYNVYNSRHLEDCKNVIHGNKARDVQDGYVVVDNTELCYEITSSITQYSCLFTYSCWDNRNLTYCDHCQNSNDLFGCAGLKRQQYCILNKRYSQEEYEALIPKIIDHMRTTGEWGEYFPVSLSPFGYNETVAQEQFPLRKEEVLARGYEWKEDDIMTRYEGPRNQIPEEIVNVPDEIVKQILTCEACGKNYRLIIQEVRFYRQMGVPVPLKCFNCRHLDRVEARNPWKLFERKCDRCAKPISTSYAPDRKEIVYCEECYLNEI